MAKRIKSVLIFGLLMTMFQATSVYAQNALNFDGTNDFVQTTFGGVLGTSNRTFEAWVKPTSGSTSNMAILDYGLNAVGSRNTFLVNPNNQLAFISGGTNANISSSSNAVTPGQWNHVALVINSGTGYLYVNGVQVGTGNLSNVNTPSGNTNMRIGQRVPGGSIPYKGEIDEVRIWDVARTATEISNNMGAEFCLQDSNLVAYYKFNDGIASGSNSGLDSLNDVSGNANTGTLNNFALSGATSNWVTGYSLTTSTLSGTLSATGCNGTYTSPSGNYVWTQSGNYTDTIQSIMGCDSVLSITLAFSTSSSSSITESSCASYTSPSGLYTWTQSGTYMDTLENSTGCDSVITINLSINNSASEFSVDACDSYTLPSGLETGPFSGTYYDTIQNAAGCDSFMIIHVSINYSTSSTAEVTACNSYTSPSGLTWITSGVYVDTVMAANGCDSIVEIDLTLDTVNNGISKDGKTLTASAVGAVYQWIDCDDNSPITGAVTKVYNPSSTGEYAVVVTQNGCTDTSECKKVTIVGMEELGADLGMSLYPNPSAGSVTIDMGQSFTNVWIRVLNAEGKLVQQQNGIDSQQVKLDLEGVNGLYMVFVYTNTGYQAFRVIKAE